MAGLLRVLSLQELSEFLGHAVLSRQKTRGLQAALPVCDDQCDDQVYLQHHSFSLAAGSATPYPEDGGRQQAARAEAPGCDGAACPLGVPHSLAISRQ